MRQLFIALCFLVVLIGTTGVATAKQTVWLSDAPNGVELLEKDQTGVTLKISVGSLDFVPVSTDEGDFSLLVANSLTRSHQIGEPNLPLANRLLAIPLGANLSTQVISSEIEEILLSDHGIIDPLMPVQPSLFKWQDPADVPFEYDRDMYGRSGYYQMPLSSTEIVGTMRALRLGMISVAPIQYNPTENILRVYKEIIVRVSFDNADWQATRALYNKYYSPVFEPVYESICNYDNTLLRERDDLLKYPIRMLIISDRMFESQLEPFIEWKVKKGFMVDIAYTDVIGSSTTAIKAHIQSIYGDTLSGDPAPSFVLFVGDTPEIPSWAATGHITDMRYCEFTGDDLPEIYFGRFSAHTTALLQPQIDKTLEYEQYTMPDPSYLGEVTLIAGVDYSHAPTYGNGQINYGTINYFNSANGITDHTWLYPASDDPGASAAIIQTVNDGIGFINYTAHCGHTGFSDPSFRVSDINDLTNEHMYLLGIGNCCSSNTFGETDPCFGEAWLQAANKGGVGYIGGSDGTLWDEDYWWGVGGTKAIIGAGPPYDANHLGAYDGMFHDHGEPLNQHYITNYAIIMVGNLAVDESATSYDQYYWEIYHLMGDPSVMTYLGVPSANNVSHDGSILMTSTSFTVQADPGSYVGISANGVLHGAAYIDVSGSVDVPLTPFDNPVTADLVVTAQNRVPYITTVEVISPDGAYIIYDDHTINDAAGNNNGIVDFGESILLGVQVINVGPDTAFNTQATLSTTDFYATITDSTEAYGTIAGDFGVMNIVDAFAFDVDGGTPDGHPIPFELTVTADERDTIWISNFNITVHAPAVGYISVTVDDASGNGNGVFDPGETVNLIVSLENTGSGTVYNVTGILTEHDGYVEIDDGNGSFGDLLAAGGTADNAADVFVASADSTCPMGHNLTCNLALSGDGGFTTALIFDFIIGDRSVFFFEDFSLEQGWTGLGGSAEWQIAPAVGGSGGSGNEDPNDDHTPGPDKYVMGNDLTASGTYEGGLGQTYWVTSPEIDCADITGVIMTYYHQLGVESSDWDHAYLEAFDGTDWVTLYHNSGTVDEADWTESVYDLSEIADHNPFFKIRFGLGPTDNYSHYCGWNIDDIELIGYVSGTAGAAVLEYTPDEFNDSLVGGENGCSLPDSSEYRRVKLARAVCRRRQLGSVFR